MRYVAIPTVDLVFSDSSEPGPLSPIKVILVRLLMLQKKTVLSKRVNGKCQLV